MKLYADRPLRATNQLLGDGLVAVWVVVWVVIARRVQELVLGLQGPGREAEEAGRGLEHGLGSAAGNVDEVPLAGDALRDPLDEGAGAGRRLAEAAQSYQDTVADLALLTAVIVVAVPVVLVLVLWLPQRVAWVREATAARRLLRAGGEHGLDLIALRALARQPLGRLSKVAPDPVRAWRERDPVVVDDLAGLELAELGMRTPH